MIKKAIVIIPVLLFVSIISSSQIAESEIRIGKKTEALILPSTKEGLVDIEEGFYGTVDSIFFLLIYPVFS